MPGNKLGITLDLENPNSILTRINIKALISSKSMALLPPDDQAKLVLLLPVCDQVRGSRGTLRASSEALNNEFFTKSCALWTERLTEGDFTAENQQRLKAEREKEQRMDPWKLQYFESVWGEKLQEKQSLQRQQEEQLLQLKQKISIKSSAGLQTRPTTRQSAIGRHRHLLSTRLKNRPITEGLSSVPSFRLAAAAHRTASVSRGVDSIGEPLAARLQTITRKRRRLSIKDRTARILNKDSAKSGKLSVLKLLQRADDESALLLKRDKDLSQSRLPPASNTVVTSDVIANDVSAHLANVGLLRNGLLSSKDVKNNSLCLRSRTGSTALKGFMSVRKEISTTKAATATTDVNIPKSPVLLTRRERAPTVKRLLEFGVPSNVLIASKKLCTNPSTQGLVSSASSHSMPLLRNALMNDATQDSANLLLFPEQLTQMRSNVVLREKLQEKMEAVLLANKALSSSCNAASNLQPSNEMSNLNLNRISRAACVTATTETVACNPLIPAVDINSPSALSSGIMTTNLPLKTSPIKLPPLVSAFVSSPIASQYLSLPSQNGGKMSVVSIALPALGSGSPALGSGSPALGYGAPIQGSGSLALSSGSPVLSCLRPIGVLNGQTIYVIGQPAVSPSHPLHTSQASAASRNISSLLRLVNPSTGVEQCSQTLLGQSLARDRSALVSGPQQVISNHSLLNLVGLNSQNQARQVVSVPSVPVRSGLMCSAIGKQSLPVSYGPKESPPVSYRPKQSPPVSYESKQSLPVSCGSRLSINLQTTPVMYPGFQRLPPVNQVVKPIPFIIPSAQAIPRSLSVQRSGVRLISSASQRMTSLIAPSAPVLVSANTTPVLLSANTTPVLHSANAPILQLQLMNSSVNCASTPVQSSAAIREQNLAQILMAVHQAALNRAAANQTSMNRAPQNHNVANAALQTTRNQPIHRALSLLDLVQNGPLPSSVINVDRSREITNILTNEAKVSAADATLPRPVSVRMVESTMETQDALLVGGTSQTAPRCRQGYGVTVSSPLILAQLQKATLGHVGVGDVSLQGTIDLKTGSHPSNIPNSHAK